MDENLKLIEGEIVPIYENEKGEKIINARELHMKLESKRQFANWIKQRIEQYDFIENTEFICFNKFVKANKYGNKNLKEYYISIDMAKELLLSIRHSRVITYLFRKQFTSQQFYRSNCKNLRNENII